MKKTENDDEDRPRLEREPTQLSEDFERHTQVPRDSDFHREFNESRQTTEKDEDEIDLDDPDLTKAATKIQASFRGYKTRKELTTSHVEPEMITTTIEDEPTVEENEDEEETAAAAVKIQVKRQIITKQNETLNFSFPIF